MNLSQVAQILRRCFGRALQRSSAASSVRSEGSDRAHDWPVRPKPRRQVVTAVLVSATLHLLFLLSLIFQSQDPTSHPKDSILLSKQKRMTPQPVWLELTESSKSKKNNSTSALFKSSESATEPTPPFEASTQQSRALTVDGKRTTTLNPDRSAPSRQRQALDLHPRLMSQLVARSLRANGARGGQQIQNDDKSEIMIREKPSDLSRPSVVGSDPPRPPTGADPWVALEPESAGWSHSVQYGNSMDLDFTLSNLAFFEALHQRVDRAFRYPDDFSRQRIKGRIRFAAELTRDGRISRFHSSEAQDDLLHLYTMALLVQALREPLPETAWLKTERAVVIFEFDYKIRIESEVPSELVTGVQKNRLLFSREAEVPSKLNEQFHEIFTHYIPPVMIFPGGFYIDLVGTYQFAKNIINDTPPESKARAARLEILHQHLKSAIRR